MNKAISPYYPPRARWYSPVFRISEAVRHGMAMDHIYRPGTLTWPGLILSVLVPGLGFYLRGPRLYGRMAMAACGILFLVFVACIGLWPGNMAFGLILSLQTSSIVYYCGPALQTWDGKGRFLFTILVLVFLGFLFYGPLRDIIQNRFLQPLQVNGRVFIVTKLAPAATVKRGDWIAYHISRYYDSEDDAWIHIRSGTGFGPVLGVAGDAVVFSEKGYSINGLLRPALPYMPSSGSFVVDPDHWFIWPNYSVRGHGYGQRITPIMLNLANVSKNQYAGKPLKRWFWREQALP